MSNDNLKKIRYTRKTLSKEVGCNVETVRFYEKTGLMPKPIRCENNYRIYFERDVKRLKFICNFRKLGLTIDEISGLLDLVDSEKYTCIEIKNITIAQIHIIEEKISNLEQIRKTLSKMAYSCDAGESRDCPIIMNYLE